MSSGFTLLGAKDSQATLDEVCITLICYAGRRNLHHAQFQLDTDPEIQGLMKQLNGHLQSMQSNTAPFAGLSEAITRSQAALDLYSLSND
jgi:kinetochore protein Fta7